MSTNARVRVLVEMGLPEPVPVYVNNAHVYLREDGRRIEKEHEVVFLAATVDSAGGVTCHEVLARRVYADGSRGRTPVPMKDSELWHPPPDIRELIILAAADAAAKFVERAAHWKLS